MTRDPRYDILFEPVRIGPVTARNRFYQVPHCNGMGYRDAAAMAAMRGMKAEGGWAVVCTEMAEIHHTADVAPYVELRIWDDADLPVLARMTDSVHAHNSLAGIELCHSGMTAANLYSREAPMGPMNVMASSYNYDPVQVRAMDLSDIRDLRRMHRQAALRAKKAGFDLVYVYAGHGLGIFQQFLSRATNQRTDEYGGSLQNRARLLREAIEDTKDAVGDRCAVPVRIAMNEFLGPVGLEPAEVEDAIAMMAELPDLWDLSLASWPNDSRTSRFSEEGFQEPHIKGVKKLTTKPVVGVGRYTSPDAMVRVIKQGIMDMIGAARPSIADPFLPKKIEEGRLDDIRECIGCNICVAGDYTKTPMRCTQNPTMGEEWRRGWHPEKIRAASGSAHILIAGAGPAGLEAARALGQRGYQVTIADAAQEAGGRVARECRLPGLAAWGRVRDWRLGQIAKLSNVSLYLASDLTADDALEFGADHIVCATGSLWRRDGMGHSQRTPLPVSGNFLTPDDLMNGILPADKHVVIYDDDHYYMANVLADRLLKEGYTITFVTPASLPAAFTINTMEQSTIQARLLDSGVTIVASQGLVAATDVGIETACLFTGKRHHYEGTVLLVTSRAPKDDLYRTLKARNAPVTAIGDARAPATIAHAVHAGRRFAEEFGDPPRDILETPFRREHTAQS
ncbi:NAD(P)-binding protein [soil metagenome]